MLLETALDPYAVLLEKFGFTTFQPGQEEVVQRVLAGLQFALDDFDVRSFTRVNALGHFVLWFWLVLSVRHIRKDARVRQL